MLERAGREGRVDDEPTVIARRLATYHELTEPVVEHYRLGGLLVPLRAGQTIPEVYAQVQDALEGLEGAA